MIDELSLFGIGICAGWLLGAIFDLLRAFRLRCSHKNGWVMVEDLLYWSFTGGFLFFLLVKYNRGVLRFYIFGGTALGVVIYSLLFQWMIFRIFLSFFQVVNIIFSGCGKIARQMWLFVKKLLIFPLKKMIKKITIMLRHV